MRKILEKALAHKETSKITKVKESDDFYGITQDNGLCFAIPKKYGIEPKVGDTITFYGKGVGYPVQGIDINGKEVYFNTKAEMEANRQKWLRELREKQAKEYADLMDKIKNDEPFETIDISGMGGTYEWGCQMMVRAGIKFLEDHLDFHFDYQAYEGVYGLCWTDTPWGKEFDKALLDSVGGNSTGAMHQATIGHLQYIHKHGYDKWLKSVPKSRRYVYPSELPQPTL